MYSDMGSSITIAIYSSHTSNLRLEGCTNEMKIYFLYCLTVRLLTLKETHEHVHGFSLVSIYNLRVLVSSKKSSPKSISIKQKLIYI